MTKIYCSKVTDEERSFEGIWADNGISYDYEIEVYPDMLILKDSINRFIPVDITQIDQVLDALFKARSLMLVPEPPDAFVDLDS